LPADILILGATGAVGSAVALELGRRGSPARLATRRPDALRARHPQAAVVELDLTRPETFAPALEGIHRVFLVARPGDDAPERFALPLIDEMVRRGVRHVVDLSALGAERRADFGLRRVELALEQSGMAFTHLRPNFFFQVLLQATLAAGIRERAELALAAGEAKVAYLDARDVGAAGAVALTEAGHENAAYALTGAEAYDHDEVAHILGVALGRTIRYVPLTDDALRTALAGAGFPPAWQERLVGFYRLVRAGACAVVTPDLERVLGRRPRTLTEFAREHATAWTHTEGATRPGL
jgi:uncharacterized protein YbjT (DUF2867 family)